MTSFQNVSLLVSFTQLPKHPHSLITVLPEASTLNNAYAVRKVKNKVSNKFNPLVGFSDDDLRNLEKIKGHFGKTPELKMYSTHGGIKKPY